MNKPNKKLRKLIFRDFNLSIVDFETSQAPYMIQQELYYNTYKLDSIDFKKGDIVIDLGAHVGIVSIYLAKKFPFIKIYAFEPIPDNYLSLNKNLELNKIMNVIPINKAITDDSRDLEMIVNFNDNSGGGTACLQNMKLPNHWYYTVESITLDDIFKTWKIITCKLLKIDIEGSEFEVLQTSKNLFNIEHIIGEFHLNSNLKKKGYSLQNLINHCLKYVSPKNLNVTCLHMAE